MITIMPATDAELMQLGAPDGAAALILREPEGITGHAFFTIDGDTVELLAVQANEPVMTDGLIRSVLGAADYRGAKYGVCRVPELFPHLRGLEFREDEPGVWRIVIEDFFRLPCPGEAEA